jgi:hypothetical protein
MTGNNEMETMRKEVVAAEFKTVSRNLLWQAEENNTTPQSA